MNVPMRVRPLALVAGIAIVSATGRAIAQEQPPGSYSQQRATLLELHLPDAVVREKGMSKELGVAMSAIGGAIVSLGVVELVLGEPTNKQRAVGWLTVGSGAAFLGTGTIPFWGVKGAVDAELTGTFLGTGASWTWMVLASSDSWSVASISTGFGLSAALSFANFVFSHPPSVSELERDEIAVRTPVKRQSSEVDIVRIESDLRRTERPIPRWLVALPTILGGLGSSLRALDGDLSGDARSAAALLGGTAMLYGAAFMFAPEPYSDYQRDIQKTGFRVALLPTGVGLVGRF